MTDLPFSSQLSENKFYFQRKRERPLSSQKSHELSNDTNNGDHIPSTSQLLLVPNKSNPDTQKPPQRMSLLGTSSISQESHDLMRPRPLMRRSSNTSHPSEGTIGTEGRPLSGISSKRGMNKKNRQFIIKSNYSPAKSGTINQSRSMGRPEETSIDTHSYSFSGLHQIHQMYQDLNENGSRLGTSMMNSSMQRKRGLASKVKDTYYKLLRKRFARRKSQLEPDSREFNEQIDYINENVRIPNEERIADIKLEEMTTLEKISKYKDKFPFLDSRKKFMKIAGEISYVSFKIISHPFFDIFILIAIVVNSILMAFSDPTTTTPDAASRSDNYFLAIYTLEMILKIFGLGFILNRHSYLRDPWNVLDFFIVITSYLPLILSSSAINLRAFRTLRVIRPLKTISSIDSLRIILLTLLAALKPLLETLFILFFLFLVFAIAGLQLFSGSLKKRCFSIEEGFPLEGEQYCQNDGDCGTVNGVLYICGKMISNPDFGAQNFDNIGSAILMAFQIVTMEGWSDIMQNLQKTFSPLASIYFILLIFIGSFFFLNLTLAIIKAEFTAHSRTSIAVRRIKKPTYDERLVFKLGENKHDVLKLIHKHNAGDASYNKYQFKKDQLIAVEKSRINRPLAKPLRKRRDALKTPPQTPDTHNNAGLLFMSALVKLRKTMTLVNSKGRRASGSTVFPESKTDIGTLNDIGSLNNFDKENTKFKSKSLSKVHPSDDKTGSRQELLNTSIDNISPVPSPIPSKLKKFFQSFNKRSNFVKRRTTEPSSGSVAEPHFTPRATPSVSEETNYPIRPSPRTEYQTSREQQSNVQIFKQQRGFGDLKIKITEPSIPNEEENEEIVIIPDSSGPKSFNHPNLPSSVPSVIEEEASEVSPSKSSISSPYKKRSKRRSQTRKAMRKLAGSPVRPLMNEKIKMKADDLSGNEIKMINIAGIRNKQSNKRLEDQGDLNTNQRLGEEIEDEIFDYMNDDEWFLEFLRAQEASGTVQSRDVQAEALLKKINQIKGLTETQRKSLVRAARSVNGSERDSLHKNSYTGKLSSAIGSDDFEGNFSRNSQSRRKGSSMQRSSKGFFEDSDFLEGRKRNSKSSENSQKVKNNALKRKNTLARRAGLKRGMTIKEEAEFNEEQEDGKEVNKGQKAVQIEDIITEEDVIAIEEIEKHMVIDLRTLKAEPNFGRNYESNSLNDVLPSKKDNELKRQEEDEKRRLRDNKMKLNYQITRGEEAAAAERKQKLVKQQKKEVVSVAVVPSAKALEVKRQQEEEKLFDEEINEAMENMRAQGNVKSNWSMKFGLKRFGFKNKNDKGKDLEEGATPLNPKMGIRSLKKAKEAAAAAEQEEQLTEEQMKDFFFLLRKIQTPYENEKEYEDSQEFINKMKVFDFPEDYKTIRRKDLEENKIVASNWSGNTVLPITYNQIPAVRIKKSLNLQDWDIWRPGVLGVLHGIRRKIRSVIQSTIFNSIVLICVFLNTIILACNGLVKNDDVNQVFTDLNTVFIIIFATEMFLKIVGLGLKKYTRDTFNLFDAVIVVVSIVETIVDAQKNSAFSAFRTLRLLRTLRILRVTKLLRSLSFMKIIIGISSRSLKKFISVLVILLLLIFIYTLLGMQLFGGQLYYANNVGENYIRQNFDSFINAFLTVLQIMTQENWHHILHLIWRSSVNKVLSISYLVSWIFIGNYIFLNLFLALLLDEFTSEEVEEELEELEQEEESAPFLTQASNLTKKTSGFSRKTMSKDSSRLRSISSLNSASLSLTDFDAEKEEPFIMFKDVACNRSLYLFSKVSPTRKACYIFSKHHRFEMFILGIIFLSCIKLILDTYIGTNATALQKASNVFDYIFLAIFILEAMAKIIGSGFILDKNSYLRDGWNVLDFIIVIASIIDVSFQSYNLSAFKVLRLLRTLRPLRFISHNQNMRIVVIALLESVGSMLSVLLVVLIIWLMFAILAVNLVGGQFGYCGGLPDNISFYRISYTQCINMGYEWENFNGNFDNVFNGLLTLFITSTQEDWPGLMYQMIDSNSADQGPIQNSNRLLGSLYFIIFIFVGSYFLVNLFIGVIFLNFTRAHQEIEFRHKFLTPHQRKWVAVQRLVLFTKPDVTMVEPTKKWMKPYFKIISHKFFEYFIMGSIVLNIIAMALSYDDSSAAYTKALSYVNYMFTLIFMMELILKNLGLGFKKYWSSNWNKVDAFVVFTSILDMVLELLNTTVGGIGPQLARVFRVLRVTRLFKLIKRFKGLKKIINTLVFSLPSLLNISALLGLIYFIFAILATFLFKDVEKGEIIDDFIHFKDFLTSIVTLFRASTGEDWWHIMFDTLYPAECVQGVTSCGTKAAIPFWVIYILICQFIFLNLFILIVIQQFEEYHLNPNNPVNRFREKLEGEFNPTWQLLSAKYQGTQIHEKQLIPFFMSLNPPLGFRNTDLTKKEVALEITQMNLTSNAHGMIFYNDVLHACMKRIYGNEDLVGNPKYLVKEEVKVKRKLEQIKKQLSFARSSSNVTPGMSRNNASVNPIFRMLFVGMTMKTWLNYSKRVGEKMKAAHENGFDYVPSESDEDDYTEVNSEEENSSVSSENDHEDVGQMYDENEHHEDAEHISEKDSEAESEELPSDNEKENSSRSTQRKREELREDKSTNKSGRIQPRREKEDYKWVIHKDIPSLNASPFKGYPADQMESSERFLIQGNFGGKTPVCLSESPKKIEGRLDSVWDGSPERICTSQILKTEGAPESPKSIFDFWDAEKLSNISPTSKRNSVRDHFYDGIFEQNQSHNMQQSNPFTIKTPNVDSNLLVPPLKKELSGNLGVKMNTNRAQAVEMYEKAEKDFLNIPLSLSRNVSKASHSDGLTPKSSTGNERFFPSEEK